MQPREGVDYKITPLPPRDPSPKPIMPKRRPSKPLAFSGWAEALIVTGKGDARPILANAITALRLAPELAGRIAHDEFGMQTVVTDALPWNPSSDHRPWSTADDLAATEWMQQHEIYVPVETVQQAVEAVAGEHKFHPVRDYLEGLVWDGRNRVDAWLSTYAGAAAVDYVRAIGRRFLISAVARIMRPGCKVDTMLILEGKQGIGKSSLLGILGGRWFSDEIADLGSKDAALMARAAWLIEMSELDAMSKGEATAIKAFLSRSTDRFRPPYGRRIIEAPRQCVITGTTNGAAYLKDETGGRRFWPVRVHTIDRDALRRDRDQLWAEAVHLFNTGAPWWMDTAELVDAAGEQQSARYIGDPWDDRISRIVEGMPDTCVPDILQELGVEVARQTQAEQNRVARVLTRLGFERYRRRSGNELTWRYRRRP